MVDFVCTDPFEIMFTLLGLGTLSVGYEIVELHDIRFLPALSQLCRIVSQTISYMGATVV